VVAGKLNCTVHSRESRPASSDGSKQIVSRTTPLATLTAYVDKVVYNGGELCNCRTEGGRESKLFRFFLRNSASDAKNSKLHHSFDGESSPTTRMFRELAGRMSSGTHFSPVTCRLYLAKIEPCRLGQFPLAIVEGQKALRSEFEGAGDVQAVQSTDA
jgi:hypothetical protein